MTPDQAGDPIVSWIGIVLQLAGSLLCLGLGLILRRNSGNRPWMTCWVSVFAGYAVAVSALLVRYYLLPLLPIGSLQQYQTQVVAGLYAIYIVAKLGAFFCLLAGTWVFATRRPLPRPMIVVGLTGIALAGLAVLLIPTDLDPLMGLQALVAVPAFVACGRLLSDQEPARRTRGSRLLATVCFMLAGLWLLYLPGFLRVSADAPGPVGRALSLLTFHNSYIDVLFEFLLGFGMILAVLDDVFREADEARAARLAEVASSEARLAQIIRAASEGIVLLDASRRIVHCNPAALEILGCSESQLLGEAFDRFITVGAPDDLWSDLGERLPRSATTPPGGHELRGRRCDGREFPMEISIRKIGESGPGGFVLIVRDRTERELFEEERERNRTQLAQAARLETIGRMVSGVAHELNNPLTAILAFAQDLLTQTRNAADTEALTTIVQQSQRCRAIVIDLLTFARSKRDDRELLSPLTIVRRVLPAIERQANARGIRLEVQVSEGLPRLEASPSGIEQVLTNLVVNAIQAVKPGGRVTIRAKVTQSFLAFIIEDDGPGIPPEVMPRLFEPFFTTKGPGEGTGLGLSVSHTIIEQHGGTLAAENRNPGEGGARFTVRLPYLDRRSAARSAPVLPQTDLAPVVQRPGAVRRILVVDDEGPIRVAIRRLLERRGWTVDEARDGLEALALLGLDEGGRFRADAYDAIVTDLKMPGISGIELHDRLAASSPESVTKLVMITGDIASPDVEEFVGRLRQPLVQKPFDMRALADLLDRIAPAGAPAAPPSS
jgi:PAS domain S-box-containing protein